MPHPNDDIAFLTLRLQSERCRADQADDISVRIVHLELADQYAAKIRAARLAIEKERLAIATTGAELVYQIGR